MSMSNGDFYYTDTAGYSTAAGSITVNDHNGQTAWVQPQQHQHDGTINMPSHDHSSWTYTYDYGAEKIEKLEKTIEMMWKLLKMDMDVIDKHHPQYRKRLIEIEVLDKLIHPDRYPKEKEKEKELEKEVHLEEDLFQI